MKKLPKNFIPPEIYLSTLPKKRISAGILILNDENKLLLVKPSYKDYWSLPGGVVEKNESPLSACIRETKEEIGLNLKPKHLFATIYQKDTTKEDEGLHLLFYYGKISKKQIESIKIQKDELEAFEFVRLDNMAKFNKRLAAYAKKYKNRLLKGESAGYLEFEFNGDKIVS